MPRFSGRNILVVGASSAIGREVGRLVAEEGGSVWAWSRQPLDDGSFTRSTRVDPSADLDEVPDLPEVLHGMVYCPGSITLGSFRQLKPAVFLDDFNVNVVGAVRALKAAHDALLASQDASVVFFSTVATSIGMQFHASVAAAKAGLEGLALSLAAEYAPRNIRFNCIAPSLTDTPLAQRLLANEKKREAAASRHPLKRYGTPADIAAAAVFLLEPGNSWITGQVLGVDGGLGSISGL